MDRDAAYQELRNRVETQEESTNKLIDNAILMKRSVGDSMKNSKQIIEAEINARANADKQIRLLTNVVGKLDRDIENVELSINKNLENLKVIGIHVSKLQHTYETEIRNIAGNIENVIKNQASIETDLKLLQHQALSFTIFKEHYEKSSAEHQLAIHDKLSNLNSLMDKCEMTCKDQISGMLAEIAEKLKIFEFGCSEMYREMKNYCEENFKLSDRQKESMKSNLTELIEEKLSVYDIRINEIRERCNSQNVEGKLISIEKRLTDLELNEQVQKNMCDAVSHRLENSLTEFKQHIDDLNENIDKDVDNVTNQVEALSADFDEKFNRLKSETLEKIENIKQALIRL